MPLDLLSELQLESPSELPSEIPSELPIDEAEIQISETETLIIDCEAYALQTKTWPISGLQIPTNPMCGHDPVEHSSGELLSSALTTEAMPTSLYPYCTVFRIPSFLITANWIYFDHI